MAECPANFLLENFRTELKDKKSSELTGNHCFSDKKQTTINLPSKRNLIAGVIG